MNELTPRQQAAYTLIATNDGVTADQVGANWHAIRGRHAAASRCEWCHTEGVSVVRTVALRPLVTYRRIPGGNLYVLRDGTSRGPIVGVDPATSEIPF